MDKYDGFAHITSQAEDWTDATGLLSDVVDLPIVPKALRFKAAGNVALRSKKGNAVIFNVAAGEVLDVRPARILVTGTDIAAANIVLLFD